MCLSNLDVVVSVDLHAAFHAALDFLGIILEPLQLLEATILLERGLVELPDNAMLHNDLTEWLWLSGLLSPQGSVVREVYNQFSAG